MNLSKIFSSRITILFSILALLVLAGCGGAPDGEAGYGDAEADAAADTGEETAAGAEQPYGGEKQYDGRSLEAAGADGVAANGLDDAEPAVPAGMVMVPAGQELEIELLDTVSTKEAQPGDKVKADIKGGFLVGDQRVPAGKWTLLGSVVAVTQPTRKDDIPGEMEIEFDTIKTEDGAKLPVTGYVTAFAESARKRNIGVVAGAAAVGAILGKAEGGDTKDAVLGAAVGAAAGAGVVRALPGKHLTLEAGDAMTVTLVEDALLPYREG